jgi:intracellular sulfur oxidation DsrE/DsrF family protein
MQYVKAANSFTNDDVKKWNMSLTEIINHLEAYPNKTQAVVVFCTNGYWEV